jgi:hypothetical protein
MSCSGLLQELTRKFHKPCRMTPKEISELRLINQKIESSDFTNAREIVSWMGAMQAQDFSMAKWAVGLRLPDSAEKDIETSFNNGEIIRTHVLRPTWHLVAAEDIYWILELTARQIKSAMKSRHKELELNESLITKCFRIIVKALENNDCQTREVLTKEFEKAGIRSDNNRYAHILLRAEIGGLICSGPLKNNKPTYALLSERVHVKKVLSREEALAELAVRFFRSHGPATLKDFTWWSGLPVTDARKGLEGVSSRLFSERTGSEEYWYSNTSSEILSNKSSVHLLPAYDEFLIGYRERSASLPAALNKPTISENGIFYPIIVSNGQVIGLWKRTFGKAKVAVEIAFFNKPDKSVITLIKNKLADLGLFLGKEISLDSKNR